MFPCTGLTFCRSQTCGGPADRDSCSSAPCGGLTCVDSEGRTRCGGTGCDGALTAAANSWKDVKESEQELVGAVEEVEKLSRMVRASLVLVFVRLGGPSDGPSDGAVSRCRRPRRRRTQRSGVLRRFW